MKSPGDFLTKIEAAGLSPAKRILIATPTLGLVRMEWVQSRYGQIIPTNWSVVLHTQFMNSLIPLNYSTADAQNVIVKSFLEMGYEWLLLIEDDTCPPADAFIRINKYMLDKKVPIVSGLYYTRSNPPSPLIYRGRGTSYYQDWKLGDKVWCDGVPTGFLLIHQSILASVFNDSPEYRAHNGTVLRRVFEVPEKLWFDDAKVMMNSYGGTSDLEFCSRIIRDKHFEKAGWPKYQKMKYPFLVDTNLFCKHIDRDGTVYP